MGTYFPKDNLNEESYLCEKVHIASLPGLATADSGHSSGGEWMRWLVLAGESDQSGPGENSARGRDFSREQDSRQPIPRPCTDRPGRGYCQQRHKFFRTSRPVGACSSRNSI